MSITLEDTFAIIETWRSITRIQKNKSEYKKLSDAITRVMGQEYNLNQLLDEISFPLAREELKKQYADDANKNYFYAFFNLQEYLCSQKTISSLEKSGFLLKVSDLNSIQHNLAKILTQRELIEKSFGEDFNRVGTYMFAIDHYLDELINYTAKTPKTRMDYAKILSELPLGSCGLNKYAKSLLTAEIIKRTLFSFENSHRLELFLSFNKLCDKTKVMSDEYGRVLDLIKTNSRLIQYKIANLGDLPLDVTFHKDRLYALSVDESLQPSIKSFNLDGTLIYQQSTPPIKAPYSLAGYQDSLILLNAGKIMVLNDDLHEILVEQESSIEKFKHTKDTSIDDAIALIPIDTAQIRKFEEQKESWKVQTIKIYDSYKAAVVYHAQTGNYLLTLTDQRSNTKTITGTSHLSNTGGLNPNIANYSTDGIYAMFIGDISYPPTIAMMDYGILICEGKSIRLVDYELKDIKRFSLGEEQLDLLDDVAPVNVIAAGGSYFGLYGSFKTMRGEDKQGVTPPIFLLFSMTKNYDISFEGALDTENLPLNIATGIAISREGHLAISSNGGQVYVAPLFREKNDQTFKVTSPSLELYKISKIPVEKQVQKLLH